MWRKFLTGLVGLGLTGPSATAQSPDPVFAESAIYAPEARSSDPFLGERPLHRATARPPAIRSLEREGFRGAIFAAPHLQGLSPWVQQAGGVPNDPAAVVIPQVPPASAGQQVPHSESTAPLFDPNITRYPEDFVFGAPRTDCLVCPPHERFWGSAEVLLGMTSGVDVPPVVTTGPLSPDVISTAAVGQPRTAALFGGRKLLGDWRAGMRAEGGFWFNPNQRWGASARIYSLFSVSQQFVGVGNGFNVMNVPQLLPIADTALQYPIFVGYPGVITGSVSTTAQTTFTGGDINLRRVLSSGARLRVEGFVGYRQLHVGDELGINFQAVGATLNPSPILVGEDSIRTRNNFYGGQLGGQATATCDRLTLQAFGALALGVNASNLDYRRTRLLTESGGLITIPLVQSTTASCVSYLGVVTEAGAKVGFRLTEHAQLTFGYTAMAWNDVRRAQEQYNLSPNLTGGTTNFFTHMFTWGAELRY